MDDLYTFELQAESDLLWSILGFQQQSGIFKLLEVPRETNGCTLWTMHHEKEKKEQIRSLDILVLYRKRERVKNRLTLSKDKDWKNIIPKTM